MAASIGGAFGVIAIVLARLFHVVSPLLKLVLLPGTVLTLGFRGEHPWWITGAVVAIADFIANVAVYALVGYTVGWLFEIAQNWRPKD